MRIVDDRSCRDTALATLASPLEARARRMVAAMNLRVAVLAGASDDARALVSAWLLRGSRGLACVVERARMAEWRAVTLLAHERPRAHEQGVVVRAVRRVAIEAALAHRGVLPQKRAALL